LEREIKNSDFISFIRTPMRQEPFERKSEREREKERALGIGQIVIIKIISNLDDKVFEIYLKLYGEE